jgi:hypothetical protein
MSDRREVAEYGPPPEWFDRYWGPKEFFTAVLKHNQRVPEIDFWRPELKPLREAYAAALFGTILAQGRRLALRLQRDTFPDFDLRIGDQVLPFEWVEADRPDRRRGKEYKDAARRKALGLPPLLKGFDPKPAEKAAIRAIRRAIKKKTEKLYNPPPCLLVYVNFWLFDKPPLTLEQFAEVVRPWRERFPEIWLLWGANAIRCWPDPMRLAAQSLPPELL